jgi:predicted DNA-binding transcriptional regulator AlpA
MTKRQVARYLSRSTRWIEMRQRDGGFPYRKVTGQCMYRASEIDAWIAETAGQESAGVRWAASESVAPPPGPR